MKYWAFVDEEKFLSLKIEILSSKDRTCNISIVTVFPVTIKFEIFIVVPSAFKIVGSVIVPSGDGNISVIFEDVGVDV